MEDGPEYPTKPITAHVIRKQLYWATFAGGLHTCGNSNIWSFGTNPKYVSQDWKTALDSPGAQHLTISRQFFELSNGGASSPINRFSARVAAAEKLNVAMRSSSGDAIIVYVSSNTTVTVDLSRITQSNTLMVMVM